MQAKGSQKRLIAATVAFSIGLLGCASSVDDATGESSAKMASIPLDETLTDNEAFAMWEGKISASNAPISVPKGNTICEGSTLVFATDGLICATFEDSRINRKSATSNHTIQQHSCPPQYFTEGVTNVTLPQGSSFPGANELSFESFTRCAKEFPEKRVAISYNSLPKDVQCELGDTAIVAVGKRVRVANTDNVFRYTYTQPCRCPIGHLVFSGWKSASDPSVITAESKAFCGCAHGVQPRCDALGCSCFDTILR